MKVPPSMRSMPEGQPPWAPAAGSTGDADGAAVTAGSAATAELTTGGSRRLRTDDVGCGGAAPSGAPGVVGPHAVPNASTSATSRAAPSRGFSPLPRLLTEGGG